MEEIKKNEAPAKNSSGVFKKVLAFVPAILLLIIGLRYVFMSLGTALLETSSFDGSLCKFSWVFLLLALIAAASATVYAKKQPKALLEKKPAPTEPSAEPAEKSGKIIESLPEAKPESDGDKAAAASKPKFCTNCGEKLDGDKCSKCDENKQADEKKQ